MTHPSAPRIVPDPSDKRSRITVLSSEAALAQPLPAAEGFAGESFDVAQMRTPEGHALYLKGRVSERVFRVSLVRDPAASRLWCLFVEQRASVGALGGNFGAVIGPGNLTQFEALACLKALAEDPGAWLGDLRRARLLAWLHSRPVVEKTPAQPLKKG